MGEYKKNTKPTIVSMLVTQEVYWMNDYVKTMRKLIGNETLITIGCGAIIEDERGRILLQHRKDKNNWGIPGGIMEIGETVVETVTREVYEETGLDISDLELYGIYSGKRGIVEYKNGDRVYSVQIILRTTHYEGELKQEANESYEHRFFFRDQLPYPIEPTSSSLYSGLGGRKEGPNSFVI
jgi:8-oxo-dGTP pyrophosphatase MutT (NUDIX family)